jgi:hypothetical protein
VVAKQLLQLDEVWSLNNFYNYGLEEELVTRTFEMHQLWHQYIYANEKANDNVRGEFYWDWLRSEHPFPIYMAKVWADYLQEFREIKKLDLDSLDDVEKDLTCVKLREIEIAYKFFKDNKSTILRYPLEAIIEDVLPPIPGIDTALYPERGMMPYFVSSIDYMSALAIYEGFDRIEYYGVELKEKTEWAMQKSGATFWAGIARGRGIEVVVPSNSVLISAPLYGIETGAQMIPIQVPEELKRLLGLEFDRQRNLHNHYTGKYTVLTDRYKGLVEEGNDEEATEVQKEMASVQRDADNAVIKMYLAEGGMNAMAHIIKNEDLALEPLTLESITRLEYIEGEEEKVEPVAA